MGTPNWSELNPDLLRSVFERLSFTSLNRVKLVCSSWYSASKGCLPNQNQIPWLILLPSEENNSSRCVFFVPEDTEKVYRSRDFGFDFAQSYCMTTCGSWLLLSNTVQNLYILNPLTGERIDLPDAQSFSYRSALENNAVCFWIDNKTKDYLVVIMKSGKFTKKGYKNWQNLPLRWCSDVFYNDKNQKLYVHLFHLFGERHVDIWDFSGDKPEKDKTLFLPCFYFDLIRSYIDLSLSRFKLCLAVTVSGDFLMVTYIKQHNGTMRFLIHKENRVDKKWVNIDSLGDEALIYDMGSTVIANSSIPGIKRNSIYYSGNDQKNISGTNMENIFVYDLTTQQTEPLPQCILSSMPFFTNARWFFPC